MRLLELWYRARGGRPIFPLLDGVVVDTLQSSEETKMRVATVETNPIFGDVRSNIRAAIELMESAPADLYVLPELCNTGYNFVDAAEASALAEEPTGFTFDALAQFTKRNSCYVVYGFAENAGGVYSSSAMVGPAGLIGLYRKVHLFDRENLFFKAGNVGFPVYDLPFGRVGMMICFDWIYPEAARALVLKGAQLIAHPSNLVLPYCPEAMITRCLENRIFAVTANRVGRENRGGYDLRFIGKSEIVSPRGEILGRLGTDEVGVCVSGVDLREATDKKVSRHNDLLVQRRPDEYVL
jgi:predicted amidohydrolase